MKKKDCEIKKLRRQSIGSYMRKLFPNQRQKKNYAEQFAIISNVKMPIFEQLTNIALRLFYLDRTKTFPCHCLKKKR